MTLRTGTFLGCFTAAALLGSCAPRPTDVARLEPAELQRRYLVGLADREAALSGVDADVNLWLEHHGTREPGIQSVLAIGGEDRLRLRISGLFGTALDAGVDGDRVRLYLPRVRGVWDTDAAAPPLAFPDAGGWLVRAWSATWQPPADAWEAGTCDDSLFVLRWMSQGDSLQVGVGPSGLPREVTLRRRERAMQLTYEGWRVQDGRAWPVRLRCQDIPRTFELTARLRIMWFRRLSEDRLLPDVPEDGQQLEWADVRKLLRFEEGS